MGNWGADVIQKSGCWAPCRAWAQEMTGKGERGGSLNLEELFLPLSCITGILITLVSAPLSKDKLQLRPCRIFLVISLSFECKCSDLRNFSNFIFQILFLLSVLLYYNHMHKITWTQCISELFQQPCQISPFKEVPVDACTLAIIIVIIPVKLRLLSILNFLLDLHQGRAVRSQKQTPGHQKKRSKIILVCARWLCVLQMPSSSDPNPTAQNRGKHVLGAQGNSMSPAGTW